MVEDDDGEDGGEEDATTRALKRAFVRVDADMKREPDWDCSLSGTTASVAGTRACPPRHPARVSGIQDPAARAHSASVMKPLATTQRLPRIIIKKPNRAMRI